MELSESPNKASKKKRKVSMRTARETRIVFLGESGSDKGYTIRRFVALAAKRKKVPKPSIDPFALEIRDCMVRDEGQRFMIHFWDFGEDFGIQNLRDVMYSCFLTNETCFVIMVQTRFSWTDMNIQYWMWNVRKYAGDAPVLLLVDCHEDSNISYFNESQIRDEFKQIKDVIYCPVKEEETEDSEFREKIMAPIIKMAAESDGVKKMYPSEWIKIRKELKVRHDNQDFLYWAQFCALCNDIGDTDAEDVGLLRFFNSLGICFSFHIGEDLAEATELKLLKPDWMINAMRMLVTDGKIYAIDGCVTREAVKQFFINKGSENITNGNPISTWQYILNIACKYGLCYELDEHILFFPALCDTNTPEAALQSPKDYRTSGGCLYSYEYLPDEVLDRLVVRCRKELMHVLHCWQEGMVIEDWRQHRIVVRKEKRGQTELLRIMVWSNGDLQAKEMIWSLRIAIEEINEELHLKPQFTEID